MASDRTDEPLDPREREALDAWRTPEAPGGFADRVLAAHDVAAAPAEVATPAGANAARGGSRRRVWQWGAVAAVGVLAGGLALLRGDRPGDASGSAAPSARETLAIGKRAVAVAEAGATLSWTVDRGAAVVAQGAGDVFYRVERGGPFRVETPAGSVRVTGTCFRVEVDMRKHWQALAGAAVGAAIVVTVYEGRVLFAGKGGDEQAVAAGQVLSAGAGGDPIAVREAGGNAVATAGGEPALAPPGAEATREELLARDAAQRAEIQRLRAQVQHAGGAPAGGRKVLKPGELDENGRPWFNPTKEDMISFAAECRVRYDMPMVMGTEPFKVGPQMAKEWGLTDEEVIALDRVLADLHKRVVKELRALYIEVTGDAEHADDLSPQAMASELLDKSPEGEHGRVNQRIAQERAGLAQAPTNLAALSPVERLIRLQAALGDETEKRLGEALGPARARALREHNGGWGWRQEYAGCPGDGSDAEVER
jgi:ferric-dicitrate binding protein FerR (iron transport regulator)